MSDLLNISVTIADRPYRLKVNQEEEAQVRNAAKVLNDKIIEFQNSYHANDKQDYLAMAALLLTTDFLKLEGETTNLETNENHIFEQVEQALSQLEISVTES